MPEVMIMGILPSLKQSYEKYLVNTKELSKKLWLDIPFGDLYVTHLPFGRVDVII